MGTGEGPATGGVHNEFHGVADFVVMAGAIHGSVVYAPNYVTDPLGMAARELAGTVGAQWRAEAGVRGLLDVEPLPVSWTADLGQHADHRRLVGGAVDSDPGDLDAFVAAFRHLPHRRLVMLGPAGSGKSAFAVLLLLGLLRTPAPDEPVPVLFSLASWNPAVQHFDAWLIDQLDRDYPQLHRSGLGARTAARLVEGRRVLPILDGLDELPPQRRAPAVRRLNEALADRSPVILTCRTAEYEAIAEEADVLRHAAVVRANPIMSFDALDHLRIVIPPRRHHRWEPVFMELERHPNGPLGQALSSPLMIGLLRAVYRDAAEPAGLLDVSVFPDAKTIENHLLDDLVPVLFADAPRSPHGPAHRRWSAARAQGWLQSLAADMTLLGTEDLTWWRLHWRAPAWARQATSGLITLVTYLLVGQPWTTGSVWSSVVPAAVIAWCIGGLLPGTHGPREPGHASQNLWPTDGSSDDVRPGRLFLTFQKRAFFGCGVLFALMAGYELLSGIPLGHTLHWEPAGRWGPLPGWTMLFTPMVYGTVMWLAVLHAQPSRHDDAATPRSGLAHGRRRALSAGLTGALAMVSFLLLVALMVSVPGHALEQPGYHLESFVLLLAEVAILRTSWGAYQKARIGLAVRRRLPWRLMAFLEDAHRLGVLRQFGTAYQFRNTRLRIRLAAAKGVTGPDFMKIHEADPAPVRAAERRAPVSAPDPKTLRRQRWLAGLALVGAVVFLVGVIVWPRIFGPERFVGHYGLVSDVAFSPDGRTLATAGSTDRSARLWDIATGDQLGEPLLGHTGSVWRVAFSPDGRLLATASGDGTARLWDVATRRQIGDPLTGHVSNVWGLAFNPDSRTLATSGEDGTARVWDVGSHRQIGESITDPHSAIDTVAFSPDGRVLATGHEDGEVGLWDVATHRRIGDRLTGHQGFVAGLAFSPDGYTLATSSGDKTARLWDVATGHQLGEPFTGHTGKVFDVAFSPDGRSLATASPDGTARLWDVGTRHQIGDPLTYSSGRDRLNGMYRVAFSPDGRHLATGCADAARVWDVSER